MCNNLPLDIQFEMLQSMSIKRQTIDGQENLKYFDVKSPACYDSAKLLQNCCYELISSQCSISIYPGNMRKPLGF